MTIKHENQLAGSEELPRYRITVQGHLHPRWSEWFDNLAITPEPGGTTALCGPVADRAALYGLLNKLRDMGLTLLAVEVLSS